MVNKCCIVNCRSNYFGELSTPVFSFPKNEDLKPRWIKFVNRKDWNPTSSAVICMKHFEEKYIKTGDQNKRFRLNMSLKPIPTLNNASLASFKNSSLSSTYTKPRKSPIKRIFQEDQFESFLSSDDIKDLTCFNESLSPPGYQFKSFHDHVIFFKLEFNSLSIPKVIYM